MKFLLILAAIAGSMWLLFPGHFLLALGLACIACLVIWSIWDNCQLRRHQRQLHEAAEAKRKMGAAR